MASNCPWAAADNGYQMNDLGNPPAGFDNGVGIGHVAIAHIRGRRGKDALAARATNHGPHFVIGLKQLLDHVAAQKSGGAGY